MEKWTGKEAVAQIFIKRVRVRNNRLLPWIAVQFSKELAEVIIRT